MCPRLLISHKKLQTTKQPLFKTAGFFLWHRSHYAIILSIIRCIILLRADILVGLFFINLSEYKRLTVFTYMSAGKDNKEIHMYSSLKLLLYLWCFLRSALFSNPQTCLFFHVPFIPPTTHIGQCIEEWSLLSSAHSCLLLVVLWRFVCWEYNWNVVLLLLKTRRLLPLSKMTFCSNVSWFEKI